MSFLKKINLTLSILRGSVDRFLRVTRRNRITKVFGQNNPFQLSDSQNLGYEELIAKLLENPNKLKEFRRNISFREILEHVSYKQGELYLERIGILGKVSIDQIRFLNQNDSFGNPRRYYYENIGWISPTLLRYVSVYSDIEENIGFENITSIAEIGIGYGGQARVIFDLAGIKDYVFYDLNPVQVLAQKYLSVCTPEFSPQLEDIRNIKPEKFDLVISNYAISELPSITQAEYLEKLLGTASHCYMIMNSGASNKTKRSAGKLAQLEFTARIPNVRVAPEVPLTGPDNYLLIK